VKRGTVVLVSFPFTDLSGQKVRPAVVVSRSDRSGKDVLLAFIGSYREQPLAPTDLLIDESRSDFGLTGLKTRSLVKLDKVATVESTIVLGELGELSAALLTQVDEKLRYAFER
jgi:mRNA interferase MazF